MAVNFYFLPKGTQIIRLPSRSSKMILLASLMICSLYMSFLCLKQTTYTKPATVIQHIQTSSYNPEPTDTVKKHVPTKREVSVANPSKQLSMFSIIDLDDSHGIEIEKKPVIMSKETVNQKLVNIKQYEVNQNRNEKQSHDRRITGLKETMIQMKLDSKKMKSTNQIQIQVKPEIRTNNLTETPCPKPKLPESEWPYLHYPVPTGYSRRHCACNPVRFYVIISMQRSGSKWLESLLISHINISSNGEIFQDRERSANVSALRSTLDKVYNLDWRHSTQKKACMGAVGFKWMLNQGIFENREEILRYFKRRHVSVIFLFRRNLLRRMISLVANRDNLRINGSHRAHVSTKEEADMLASYKPKLNAKLLIQKLKRDSAVPDRAVESFNSVRHMLLYYEDLVHNNTEKLNEVLDFLRLPRRRMSSQHVKIHTKPLSELVKNWNSVDRVLRRSQFSDFLKSE